MSKGRVTDNKLATPSLCCACTVGLVTDQRRPIFVLQLALSGAPCAKVVHSPLDKENLPGTPHSKWSPIKKQRPASIEESCYRCTKRLVQNHQWTPAQLECTRPGRNHFYLYFIQTQTNHCYFIVMYNTIVLSTNDFCISHWLYIIIFLILHFIQKMWAGRLQWFVKTAGVSFYQ